jgi:hypothetical protein
MSKMSLGLHIMILITNMTLDVWTFFALFVELITGLPSLYHLTLYLAHPNSRCVVNVVTFACHSCHHHLAFFMGSSRVMISRAKSFALIFADTTWLSHSLLLVLMRTKPSIVEADGCFECRGSFVT